MRGPQIVCMWSKRCRWKDRTNKRVKLSCLIFFAARAACHFYLLPPPPPPPPPPPLAPLSHITCASICRYVAAGHCTSCRRLWRRAGCQYDIFEYGAILRERRARAPRLSFSSFFVPFLFPETPYLICSLDLCNDEAEMMMDSHYDGPATPGSKR